MDSINRFLDSLPPILVAILLLILAFVVAWIAQKIAVALLRRVKIDERLGARGVQDARTGSTAVFLGKLVFVVVLLLMLPAAFDRLGMTSVSEPITGMIGSILGYLPNLIAAGLIAFIGHMIAKLIGQLVESLLLRVNVDRGLAKVGIKGEPGSFAKIIGNVVYALILIPVVIAALHALNISAISEPAVAMLNQVFAFLPKLVVAIAVIAIGIFIANLIGRLLTDLLAGVGADSWLAKLRPQHAESGDHAAPAAKNEFSLSKLLGTVVRVLIIVLFVVEGLSLLELSVLEQVGTAVIGYLPSVLGAAVILVLAVLAGNWVESLITRRSPERRSYAMAAKVAILVLAVFMALNQLQLSQEIVTWAFLLVLGAAAVAFAISFGVGGRQFAANRLQKLESKLDEPSSGASGTSTGTASSTSTSASTGTSAEAGGPSTSGGPGTAS